MSLPRLSFTIGRKIYAIIALCFVGCLGIMGLQLNELWNGLEEQRKIELNHLANLALSIVKEEHAAAQSGKISMDEAKTRAAARVGALRYGADDYFWINDMHPRVVMHPLKPELNGRDVTATKDADGRPLYTRFVELVNRQSAGFVPYNFVKPGGNEAAPKVSYIAGFAPWGWVIGTGVFVDDIRQQVWQSASRALSTAGVVLLLTALVSVFVARRTTKGCMA
jgi:methyl-accepting chemotaxis protein